MCTPPRLPWLILTVALFALAGCGEPDDDSSPAPSPPPADPDNDNNGNDGNGADNTDPNGLLNENDRDVQTDPSIFVGVYEVEDTTRNEAGCDQEGGPHDIGEDHFAVRFCDEETHDADIEELCEDPDTDAEQDFCDTHEEFEDAEWGGGWDPDDFFPQLLAVWCSDDDDDDALIHCDDIGCVNFPASPIVEAFVGNDEDGWEGEYFTSGMSSPEGECTDPTYEHTTVSGDDESLRIETRIHIGDSYTPSDGMCTTDAGQMARNEPCAELEIVEATRIE